MIEGALADAASLDRATQGVDLIVSAVQGGPELIVDGQVALAQAGKRNGVRRILPFDFALDLFKATPGEHAAFDMRRTADERIAAIGLVQVNILQGGFMELFTPGKFAFAGDRVSFRQAGEIVSKLTGRELKPVSFGSEADLRAAMAASPPDSPPEKRVMLAYLLYMLNGQTALTDLQNDRHPDRKLERFTEFASRKLPIAAHA